MMKTIRGMGKATAIIVIYVIIVALHAISVLTGGKALWGVDMLYYLPGSVMFALLIIGLLPVIPVFRRAIESSVSRLTNLRTTRLTNASRRIIYAAALCTAFGAFWLFRQSSHFLGDGYLWASHIKAGTLFNMREPLITALMQGFYNLMNASWMPVSLGPAASASVVSALSGMLFLVYAYRTVNALSERNEERLFLFLALISTGAVALFFGYVEAYAPLAAGVMVFVYYGIIYLQHRTSTASIVLVFAIVLFMHFSVVALIPGLIVLFWFRRGGAIDRRRYYSLLCFCVAAGLAVLWLARDRHAFSGFFREIFMPFVTVSEFDRIAYPLFSLKHLQDLANEMLLICPFALLALAAIRKPAGKRGENEGRILFFLETITVFYFLEFAIYKKILGVSRDWDIFSPIAIPLALLAAMVLLERFRGLVKTLVVLSLSILVVHTVPWIAVNSIEGASIERFARLAENGYWSDYARAYAYDRLGIFFSDRGELDRGLAFCSAAASIYPRNLRYIYNAASLHLKRRELDEAARLYEQVIERDSLYWQAHYNVGLIYIERSDWESAERAMKTVLSVDSTCFPAYKELAFAYEQQNKTEMAAGLYEKSIKLGNDDPEVYKSLSLLYLEAGNDGRAEVLLKKAIELDGEDSRLYYFLGRLYAQRGDMAAALGMFEHVLVLDPDDHSVRFDLAIVLNRLGKDEETLRHLYYILERRPNDVRVINNIGAVYLDAGKLESALEMFKNAVRIMPDSAPGHLNLAQTYYMLGDYAESWRHVAAAEKIGATVPPRLLERLAGAMERPGR
jgi:tetratricopeptide (TPR) repeat protein